MPMPFACAHLDDLVLARADQIVDLLHHFVHARRGQVDLVDHGQELEPLLHREVHVGDASGPGCPARRRPPECAPSQAARLRETS